MPTYAEGVMAVNLHTVGWRGSVPFIVSAEARETDSQFVLSHPDDVVWSAFGYRTRVSKAERKQLRIGLSGEDALALARGHETMEFEKLEKQLQACAARLAVLDTLGLSDGDGGQSDD